MHSPFMGTTLVYCVLIARYQHSIQLRQPARYATAPLDDETILPLINRHDSPQ